MTPNSPLPLHPTGPPGDEDLGLEIRLRDALDSEAQRISPSDRLGAILAESHTAAPAGAMAPPHRSRWSLTAAAAAAVLTVVGGMLWLTGRPGEQTAPTGTPPASDVVTSSTTASPVTPVFPAPTVTSPAPGPTSTAPPQAPVGTQEVPVYYAGARLLGTPELGLFREFVQASLSVTAGQEERAAAALRVAMGTPPAGAAYEQLWAGVQLLDVAVTADRISVELSGPSSVSSDRAPVAVQQLVWTAQAAVGRGNLPVRFVVKDGAATVAGTLQSAQDYRRPTDENEVAALLAPLWIDNPARGQVLTAGAAITVTGQASTFEATLSWQLLEGEPGGSVVHDGFATASVGAPARGEFTFSLPPLAAGSYTIRVFEVSMKDGSDAAEQQIPFTVR